MLFHLSKKSRFMLGCLALLAFSIFIAGCSSTSANTSASQSTKTSAVQSQSQTETQTQTQTQAQPQSQSQPQSQPSQQESKTAFMYKTDIGPLLDLKCAVCHSASGKVASIPLDTYSNVMKNVAPGKPEESRLIKSIDGGGMSNKVNRDDVQKIKTWVSQGAKE